MSNIHFRFAKEEDLDLYFNWTNEKAVRENSYRQEAISYAQHTKWFLDKIHDQAYFFYLFFDEKNSAVGQVRIQQTATQEALIGISIPPEVRSKGLGVSLLVAATEDFLKKFPADTIYAYIKKENQSSFHSFIKAGFVLDKTEPVEGIESYIMIKRSR
jgi:RimJ/RimL family protein N-acetyltransferase